MQNLILQISDTDMSNSSLIRELGCLKVFLRDPLSSLVPTNRLELYRDLRLDRGVWGDLLVFSVLGTPIILPFYHQPNASPNYSWKNIDINYGFSLKQSFLNKVLEKVDIGYFENKKNYKTMGVSAVNREGLPTYLINSSEVKYGRKEIEKMFLHVFRKTLTRLEKAQ